MIKHVSDEFLLIVPCIGTLGTSHASETTHLNNVKVQSPYSNSCRQNEAAQFLQQCSAAELNSMDCACLRSVLICQFLLVGHEFGISGRG